MQNVNRKLDKTGKKFQKLGSGLSVGLTLPLLALGAASVNAFDKQAKAIAQVDAGLKATGNQVGKTSDQLQQMATDLQNNSLFGDEEILKDATAQLLTFTNIAGTQFARTQQAALDLATRLDGDLKSSSIQLGKALNDPVANLSALSRSGIQFSTSQKKTINALVKTNRLADAQTIILDELEKQYGGSAAAAAAAGKGPLQQLGNIIGDVTEDFGKIILEGIQPFIAKLKELALKFKGLSPETKKMIVIISAFAASLGPVIVLIGTLIRNLVVIIPLIKSLTVAIAANPIGAFAIAITAVAGALLLANSRMTPLTNATKEFANLTAKATSGVAKERAELSKYLKVAKNEKLSKEDRATAISKLNKLSPKYLGDLTLEAINTDKATTATDNYVNALLTKAKVIAAEEKLVEVQKKMLDLQLSLSDSVKPSVWQNLGNAALSAGSGVVFASNSLKTISKNITNENSELKKLEETLLNFITTNEAFKKSLGGGQNIKVTPTIDLSNDDLGDIEEIDLADLDKVIADSGGVLRSALENAGIEDFLNAMSNSYDAFIEATDENLIIPFEEKMNRLREIGELVGESLSGAFENLSGRLVESLELANTGFQGFVKGLIKTVTKLIAMMLAQSISQSIAGATSSGTATGPAAIFTTPAFIATAVGGVLAAFAAIPRFETGGVFGGSSYYGDKILARVNSGELVLNQGQQKSLYGMIQPAGSSETILIIPDAKITGNDIVISYDRTIKKNNRLG